MIRATCLLLAFATTALAAPPPHPASTSPQASTSWASRARLSTLGTGRAERRSGSGTASRTASIVPARTGVGGACGSMRAGQRSGVMIVKVPAGGGGATLEEPEDCRRFHVEASGGDTDAVARAVGSSAPAPADHVWVAIEWIRGQAAGRGRERPLLQQ